MEQEQPKRWKVIRVKTDTKLENILNAYSERGWNVHHMRGLNEKTVVTFWRVGEEVIQ